MNTIIDITVDGRRVKTEERTMLLKILQEQGIYVPTLCHHPALEPSGACRLCVVEVSKDSWKGSSKLVTSCLYPAEDGLIVKTRTAAVLKTRRALLELYLAQCPAAEEIKMLARLEGIDTTSFKPGDPDSRCILCGLCTRVCQDCGPGAISTLWRGMDKKIAPNPEGFGQDCTGCRACAYICPTDAIPMEQKDQVLKIWNREFVIPVCTVDPERCRGCGICEEVCPFSVPRSAMKYNHETIASIPPEACLGCGICAGACPTGAISQRQNEQIDALPDLFTSFDLPDRDLVFACSRSPFNENEDLIRVSCIGSVDPATLLAALAGGARSVSLMCRDRSSCPFCQGGEQGEEQVKLLKELLQLVGLDEKRIALLSPPAGQDGPEFAWQKHIVDLARLKAPTAGYLPNPDKKGFDRIIDILDKFAGDINNRDYLPEEIMTIFKDQPVAESYDLLDLGSLPVLHILFKRLTGGEPVLALLEIIIALLNEQNIYVQPFMKTTLSKKHDGQRLIYLTSEPPAETAGQYETINFCELPGVECSAMLPFSFAIKADERAAMFKALEESERSICSYSIAEYLQYHLLLRTGSWLKTIKPVPEPALELKKPEIEARAIKIPDRFRIKNHPILPALEEAKITFTFNGYELKARQNEVISSALYAAGIHVFGHHSHDRSAQGIYCVNGQCSQCMVVADGKPVKGCMTPVKEGMTVESVEGSPKLENLPPEDIILPNPLEVETEVLIIGGGPAGISAALELGTAGVKVLLIDDKQELGGKLSLQTHNFFGSVKDCYAGSRGMQIGEMLVEKLTKQPTVKTWLNSSVVGVFSDGKFGVSGNGAYRLVKADKVLFTTGAREKSLAFPGADLPGVYGAGAFQTLVNRDLIRCAERLFIIGGGNVGLIGAYHALQAGIDVVGLVEALPRCGGYKVHEDKIKRFGVPVWTSHTVLRIEGEESVERVITAAVDQNFKPIPGTEKVFTVDTVLIAVGLAPVNELYEKAKEYGLEVYAAGDANEIAEASAAIFSGKIIGRKIAQAMGIDLPVPSDWENFGDILKQHGADSKPYIAEMAEVKDAAVYPVIRCMQEIPCNPCTEACPKNCITIQDSILSLPEFSGDCIGCGRCVLACPGLAINLVVEDYDPDRKKALLMMPFEFVNDLIPVGNEVTTTDMEGNVIGTGKVIAYKERKAQNSRRLIMLEVPFSERHSVAGFRVREIDPGQPLEQPLQGEADPIVCRCERVRKSEIVQAIRDGVRDMNQLKALLRTGLGGCNGKTCTDLILRIYREEGIDPSELTLPTHRPLVAEVHLGDFITGQTGEAKDDNR